MTMGVFDMGVDHGCGAWVSSMGVEHGCRAWVWEHGCANLVV